MVSQTAVLKLLMCIFFSSFVLDESPNKAALMSVKQLLQSGVSQGFLCPGFTVLGHRDLGSTQCPGDKLYAALPQLS